MTDLPGDPNWLLATVAQSAAVIVAVLALFQLTHTATLLRERRSLQMRRRLVELMLLSKQDRKDAPADSSEVPGQSRRAHEIEHLQIEHRILDQALARLWDGSRPLLSLLIVGYLTAAGIFFPLILMPARNNAFDPAAVWSLAGLQMSGLGWKRLVVGVFAIGVLAALAQIAWTSLRSSRSTADLE